MRETYEATLHIDNDDIIQRVAGDKPYASLPLSEYAKEQLIELVLLLCALIRQLILGKIGLPDDIQEILDQLHFSSGKDSQTSGMRPSSDMYGRNSHTKGRTASSGKEQDKNAGTVGETVESSSADSNRKNDAADNSDVQASGDNEAKKEDEKSGRESESNGQENSESGEDTSDANSGDEGANEDLSAKGSGNEKAGEGSSTDADGNRKTGTTTSKDAPGKENGGKDAGDVKDPEEEERESEEAYHKDHNRSRRKKSGLKPGKQPGARGFGFHAPAHVDCVHRCVTMPDECVGCPHWDECRNNAINGIDGARLGQVHHVYDIEIIVHDTIIQPAIIPCPNHENNASASADSEECASGVIAPVEPAVVSNEADTGNAEDSDVNQTITSDEVDTGNAENSDVKPTDSSIGDVETSGNTTSFDEKGRPIFAGSYPENAKGPNQYGLHTMILCCLLYCVGFISLSRIQQIVSPLCGFSTLSPATIEHYIVMLAESVKLTVEAILLAQGFEHVVHCDETGAKVDGNLCWIHCIATEAYTFVSIQEKRGKEGMDMIGFLAEYTGCVVHDCWASYWGYMTCLHAVCNEHIERELNGLSKFFKNANQWADDMITLLQEMLQAKHIAQARGETSIPLLVYNEFQARFDELIERGKELHPYIREPGKNGKRGKKGKARSLIERMEKRKAEIFRFLDDFSVDYTNNIGEQAFRLLGTKRAVGIFRSMDMAKYFCIIWSYLASAKKQGHSYHEAIYEAFMHRSMHLMFPNGIPSSSEAETKAA